MDGCGAYGCSGTVCMGTDFMISAGAGSGMPGTLYWLPEGNGKASLAGSRFNLNFAVLSVIMCQVRLFFFLEVGMNRIINTVDDLMALAKRIKSADAPIAVDTETNGLFPIEDKIVGWSLAFSETEGYYVPRNHRYSDNVPDAQHKQLMELLQQKKLVWHNGKFDLEFIKTNLSLDMPVYSDTMVMAYLACFKKLALKEIMKDLFHYDTKEFKELLAEKYGKQWKSLGYTAADLTAEDIAEYAVNDVLYTYKLFNLLKDQMEHYKSIFKLELNLVPIVAQMNLSGITVDAEKLKGLAVQARGELDKRYALMQQVFNEKTAFARQQSEYNGGLPYPAGSPLAAEKGIKPLTELYNVEFNPNSPYHVRAVLIEGFQLPILKRTEKSVISTDAEVLEQYVEMGCDFAKQLQEYRSLNKYITNYLEKIPEICSHTGKLYASFNQMGAESGRFSCPSAQNWQDEDRTVNLQNQPRDDDKYNIRTCYLAPEGYTWVKADYKQQEYRAMCNIAGEASAIQKFKEGVDFHTATARMMFDIPDDQEVPKELRNNAKTVNFGLTYGMGVDTLAKRINHTVGETKQLYDKYFELLPHVRALSQWAYNQVEQTEMIKTYFGRVRKLEWRDKGTRQADMIKNSAFNTLIQGTSADITKIAMLRVKDRVLDKYPPEIVQMKLQVHDELDFIVRNDMLDEVCAKIKNAMTIPTPENWVDFEVDVEIGPTWSELDHKDWEGEFVTDAFTGWGDVIPKRYQSYLMDADYSAGW